MISKSFEVISLGVNRQESKRPKVKAPGRDVARKISEEGLHFLGLGTEFGRIFLQF